MNIEIEKKLKISKIIQMTSIGLFLMSFLISFALVFMKKDQYTTQVFYYPIVNGNDIQTEHRIVLKEKEYSVAVKEYIKSYILDSFNHTSQRFFKDSVELKSFYIIQDSLYLNFSYQAIDTFIPWSKIINFLQKGLNENFNINYDIKIFIESRPLLI